MSRAIALTRTTRARLAIGRLAMGRLALDHEAILRTAIVTASALALILARPPLPL